MRHWVAQKPVQYWSQKLNFVNIRTSITFNWMFHQFFQFHSWLCHPHHMKSLFLMRFFKKGDVSAEIPIFIDNKDYIFQMRKRLTQMFQCLLYISLDASISCCKNLKCLNRTSIAFWRVLSSSSGIEKCSLLTEMTWITQKLL